MRFDPYEQAEALARHIGNPESRLVVALGAEAWCQKCRDFRPQFDTLASQDSAAWVWLDIDTDASFLGGYIPDDLPQLLVYAGAVLLQRVSAPVTGEDLRQALLAKPGSAACDHEDPGIAGRLQKPDWASQ